MNTETKVDLAAAEKELAQLQAREQTLKNLRAQLTETAGDFDTIVGQLKALANFWTAVRPTLPRVISHAYVADSI